MGKGAVDAVAITGVWRTLDDDWVLAAKCADMEPAAFSDEKRWNEALLACANCPVQTTCLLEHIAMRERLGLDERTDRALGVVGGTMPQERKGDGWRSFLNV